MRGLGRAKRRHGYKNVWGSLVVPEKEEEVSKGRPEEDVDRD